MYDSELEYWLEVTASSETRWVEDAITRRSGNGALYYTGGENGRYMRLSPDGKLTIGTYEYAYPHIGEAVFTRQAERQFDDFNDAFEAACQLGGKQFLADMFANDQIPQEPELDDDGFGMTMRM